MVLLKTLPMTVTAQARPSLAEEVLDFTIHLSGNVSTLVHIVKYRKDSIRPRLAVFDTQIGLVDWCNKHNVLDAINGGFTLHHTDVLLGEHRINGQIIEYEPFTAPWDTIRGTLYIPSTGNLSLAPRHHFPKSPSGDLLQAAPLLVQNNVTLMELGKDPEGIAASSDQLDDDWTVLRFPRAGIGVSDDYIWTVATDGYVRPEFAPTNAGLSLIEFADIFVKLGAESALNLDGGSSATQVSGGRLINHPSAGIRDGYTDFPLGRPIPSAIIFEPR